MTEIHSETGAETNTGPQRTMPFLTRLVAYNPGLYTFATLGWVIFRLWPLVPGLLGKVLFDVIEGRAPAGLTIWTLIGLTVAVGLARCAAISGATVAWAGWYQRARGLIQYNLLRRVFSRPGAQAVPGTMGESISMVRDDSDGIAQEEQVIDRLRVHNEDRRRAMVRDRVQSLALDSLFNSTATLWAGLVLLVAAGRMRAGTFTVGDFVLFSTSLMQIADYTGFMGYLVRTYQQAGVSFARATSLLQGAQPIDIGPPSPALRAWGRTGTGGGAER